MATTPNVVKFKRSSVAGKVPLTTDLNLGELALNTYDGRIYLKKSVAGVETVVALQPFPTGGSSGQVLSLDSSGNLIWSTTSGTGTVTNTSVVSVNGFAGTVATSSTTPAITLKTTVDGLLKGNSTTGAISSATAGTDYVDPNGSYSNPVWITSLDWSKITNTPYDDDSGYLTGSQAVRYDVSQTLTANQQAQARENMDAISTGDAFIFSLIF